MPKLFQQSRGLDFEVNTATGHNHQALSESLKRDSGFSVVRPSNAGSAMRLSHILSPTIPCLRLHFSSFSRHIQSQRVKVLTNAK